MESKVKILSLNKHGPYVKAMLNFLRALIIDTIYSLEHNYTFDLNFTTCSLSEHAMKFSQ